MIARIAGIIVEQGEKYVIIETHGIGYLVYTPHVFLPGATTTLFTHLVVREDSQELYGFNSPEERLLFSRLISVSGIGPKTGLAIFSLYSLSLIVQYIKQGDSKALSLVPGIGKKTAEKVVIDLKDKLDAFTTISEQAPSATHDLVEALLSLGYRDQAIQSVLGTIDTSAPLSSQIRQALQHIQS